MDKNRFLSTILRGAHIEVTDDDLEKLDIVSTGSNKYHIISNLKTYRVELLEACYETKQFKIRVNGKKVQLKLENDFDLKIKQLGFTSQESKEISSLNAPMPGMVLEIMTSQGDNVKKGDPLIILEAMKMENIIKSPIDGTIKSVDVEVNQAVNKNQSLISFS